MTSSREQKSGSSDGSLQPHRPLLLLVGMLGALSVVLAGTLLSQPKPLPMLQIRGADISFTLQEEANNQLVSDYGMVTPIEQILANHGANFVRLRLWVNPRPGTSDLESVLALARRAAAAGHKLLLNIHYSDSWADRTAQPTPLLWRELSHEDLALTVESYTRETVSAFSRQGTPPAIVQIGNEISRGMLWPHGQIYTAGGEHWYGFSELLRAAARGVLAGNPAQPPRVMIHSDTGGDHDASVYFYDQLRRYDVSFDVIGLTYYPFWNGSLADLDRNVSALADRYDKDVIIAETAYPWTLSSGDEASSVVSSAAALPEAAVYPPTPQGQAKFFAALNKMLREVPDGRGAGYFIWEPGWLPGVRASEYAGNTHSNLTLFDWHGQGLPALEAFRPTGRAAG